MSKVNAGWVEVSASPRVLTYVYSFGPGIAKAFAIEGPKGFVVVSPPCRVPDEAFTELAKKGEIAALVAANAFHYLGVPEWHAKYPGAKLLAPAQSIPRVSKKTGLSFVPLAEAGDVVGPSCELVDLPGYRTGEVLVRARGGGRVVWCVTDVILNMPTLPKGIIGLIFKWTNSAPGLKVNRFGPTIMVKDKARLFGWLRDEHRREPPALLVPSHGDDLSLDAKGEPLGAVLG